MSAERCLACMKLLNSGVKQCPHCGARLPCAPNPQDCLQPGTLLGGRFLVGRTTARDGSGILYTVFDHRLQAIRSMKEFFPRKCARSQDMSPVFPSGQESYFRSMSGRFLQEARIMAVLSENRVSGTVDVFDRIKLNGNDYILMEHLNGCTLDEWLTAKRKALPWRESVQYMRAVLQALHGVHTHGYLHRNVSLSNVFRMYDGSIRVVGFGSAEPMITAQKDPGSLWPSSKRYYSPGEQISNSAQGPWTDVYAAGACLFKLTAGGWPSDHRNGEAFPSLRALGVDVPENLDRAIGRATQPEPRKRYQTAAAMLEALNHIREDESKLPGTRGTAASQNDQGKAARQQADKVRQTKERRKGFRLSGQ